MKLTVNNFIHHFMLHNLIDTPIKYLYLNICIKWMGGWAVESTGLENRQGWKPFVGSNPTPSAILINSNIFSIVNYNKLSNNYNYLKLILNKLVFFIFSFSTSFFSFKVWFIIWFWRIKFIFLEFFFWT